MTGMFRLKLINGIKFLKNAQILKSDLLICEVEKVILINDTKFKCND